MWWDSWWDTGGVGWLRPQPLHWGSHLGGSWSKGSPTKAGLLSPKPSSWWRVSNNKELESSWICLTCWLVACDVGSYFSLIPRLFFASFLAGMQGQGPGRPLCRSGIRQKGLRNKQAAEKNGAALPYNSGTDLKLSWNLFFFVVFGLLSYRPLIYYWDLKTAAWGRYLDALCSPILCS